MSPDTPPKEREIVRRAFWTGLVAGVGALTGIVARRISAAIWRRTFKEDPPE